MDEILSPEQWNELQIRLRMNFPILSDDDLQYHESSEHDLLRMVGYTLKLDPDGMKGVFIVNTPEFSRNSLRRNKVRNFSSV